MSVEVHVLASGSDGNCYVVRNEDTAVMVDAGLSFKKIQSLMDLNGIDEKEIQALFVTHEHSDHVSGAGIISRKLDVPIYCNENTFNAAPYSQCICHI